MCDKPGTLTCTCGTRYCSCACKAEDEEFHRRLCGKQNPKRPHTDRDNRYCTILVWPQRESCPKFISCNANEILGDVLDVLLDHADVLAGMEHDLRNLQRSKFYKK